MVSTLRTVVVLAGLLAALAGHARTQTLLRHERVCDESGALCLRGTLGYVEGGVVRFHGRVVRPAPPGEAAFLLAGRTEGGQRVTFELRFEVAGRYSEIVDVKRGPGPPFAETWRLLGLFYRPR